MRRTPSLPLRVLTCATTESHKSTDDRRVASWAWDFGDGSTSNERDPAHTYAAPGTYNVTLTVTDDDGLTSQRQISYRAAEPLAADFSLSPFPIYEGGDYIYMYNQSSFRLGPKAARHVEWGSNSYFYFRNEGASGEDYTYNSFTDSGTYEVKLKIGTDGGIRYTASKTIQVLNYPPSMDINPGKTLVWSEPWTSTPVTVSDPSSVDAATLRCNWDFKDGQTSEVLNCNRTKAAVTHTYNLPGVYDAALTVTDKDGGSSTDVATFVVKKHPTGLALLETQNAGPGSPVLMRARLTDEYLGQPLGGKVVRFTVNGASAEASTNADGIVEASVPLAAGAALTLATVNFDEDGLYLSSGVLVTGAPGPNVRPVGTRDSKGTDFWLMSPRNYAGRGQLYLFIGAETATTGTVSAPGVNFSTTFSVNANAVTRVTIPLNALSNTSDLVERKGIRVTAQNPVAVYGLNREQFSTDAFLGLPTDALGTDHINLGYRNSNVFQGTEFGLVATADATSVTITPSVKAGTRAAGVPFTINLNQGETFLLQHDETETGDLSGSRVSSDKPIAVFGANECANVPVGFAFCDYLVEQLPPTTAWGRRFVTVPLATRQKGDTFRFVAAADATRVYVNGKQTAFLHRGGIHEQLIEGPAHIIADRPILVMQYSNGAAFDLVAGNNGDPFMVLVPPHERFLNRYTISTEMFGYNINYVNVVAPASAVGQITLDGAAIPAASFTPIGNSGFSGAQVAVSVGTHNLSGAQPFGASVYGYALTDSYGYSAGFSLNAPVGDGRSVSLAPETSTQDQGTQGCVTATVTDEHNTLLVGERVEFGVSGANSATASVETDGAGQAQFCYTGANRGNDLVVASVGLLASDTATRTWLSNVPNQAPAVNSGADAAFTLPGTLTLEGTATDDGLPDGAALVLTWTKTSGPGAVAFGTPNATSTTASFGEVGTYVLRLTANDSELTGFDELTVTVNPEPVNLLPVVSAGPDQHLAVKSNLVANAGNETALVEGNITGWTEVTGETWTQAPAGTEGFPAALSGQTYFYAGEAAEAELRQDVDLSAFAPGIAAGTQQFEFKAHVRSRDEATPDTARVVVEYRNASNTATIATLDSGPITSTGGWHLTEDTRPAPPGAGWMRVRLVASRQTGPSNDAFFDGVSLRALGTAATKLQGTASDDGLPIGAALTSTWSKVNGPGSVTFSNASAPDSSAVFSAPGTYVLRLSTKAGIIGKHWAQTMAGGLIPTYCLRPTRPTTVSVALPDGKVYKFEARASKRATIIADECQQGAPLTAPSVWYKPMPGTKGKLESLEPNEVITVYDTLPGPVELRNNGDFQWYNPKLFRYTAEDGTVYVIHQQHGVQSITDPNGNTLTVSADAITHSDGQSITFTRDAQGRVTQITDPAGKSLAYAYDANGDLTGFTDREGHTTTYTYNASHHLLKIIDPLGREPIFNQYDASGRLTGHTDASGKTLGYVHDLDGRAETTTDRLGHATRYEYDARGNVTRVVDARGGVTLRTYDANDNMTGETNALGQTTTYTYNDQDAMTSVTDPLGNVTRYTRNDHGKVLSVTDALGRVPAFTYDPFDNPLSTTDPLGNKATHTYGWRGRLTSTTDPLGNVTQYAYTLEGNLTLLTDALGNTAEYDYNSNNIRKSQTLKRTTADGAVERLTTFFFYGDGADLLYTRFPDETKTETLYNAAKQPTASIDQQGRRTTYDYDEGGSSKSPTPTARRKRRPTTPRAGARKP